MRKLTMVAFIAMSMYAHNSFAQCTTYPYPLTNGNTADANQVTADLNYLAGCLAPLANPHFTGNVGIGTTSPAATLDIYSGYLHVGGVTNPTISQQGAYVTWNALTGSTGETDIINNKGGGAGGIAFMGSASLSSPWMFIAGSGNVGIGTVSPAATLDVNGSIRGNSSVGALQAYRSDANQISLMFQRDGAAADKKKWEVITYDTGDFGIRASNDAYSASTEAMHITRGTGYAIPYVYFPTANVGIGTATPSYPLTVIGTVYASGGAGGLSDIRDKDKVTSLPAGAVDLVGKLRPVSFVWKDPRDDGMKGEQYGFIAQEVEAVLPSVVLTQNDARRTKGLKYTEIIPVLTKALQEQQAEIEQLRATVGALQAKMPAAK